MSEEIRALIFIAVIVSVPLFLFLRYSSSEGLKKDVKTWISVWVFTTFLAFLAPNFWLYAITLSIFLIFLTRNNPILKLCLFFLLLPSIPAATVMVPGFGIINYFIYTGPHHVIILVLLLPLLISSRRGLIVNKSVNILAFVYFLLLVGIAFRDTNVTNALRFSTITALATIIPFYAVGRTVHKADDLKKIMFAAILGIFLQSIIGVAETLKGWHLYNGAINSLGLIWGVGNYLSRNNLLRASAALGHPIVLGYISAIGLGLYLYFYPKIQKKMRQQYWIGITVFIGGLLASLSRGPWVGAVAMILVFLLTGQKAIGKLTKLMFGGFFVLAILSTTQAGKSFIELIPFVSNDENIHAVSTISYRQQLLDQSWIVIKRNPFFGSANYLDTPEMETMRQGEGIIDIVNSYLVIALSSGLIGLGLFLSIFAAILYKMYKLMPTLKQNIKFRDLLVMDRALFATIIGVMVTIFTMSGISISQQYYWSLLGLACAFIRIAKTEVINHILETNRR